MAPVWSAGTALPLWPIGQAPFLPVIGQRGSSSPSSTAPTAASGLLLLPSIMAVQGHLPGSTSWASKRFCNVLSCGML
eukprot:CAMPEP_0115290206 /NCGR_PEP_ID=MMETSP0270-20121206/63928_1 /TAXON_ID=71861 /ORGANISM="Scrippsiella trochoidea, Strain CCMP3099" /LENGTH=77 /DNA_ID=CAMNT_0002707455 /DNA_START=238 /DNA_END=471 /DNA_ORIENTATION=-